MVMSPSQELYALRSAGTPFRSLSAGITGQVIRATPGEIAWMHVDNTDATDSCYVKLYNKATAPVKTDTPVYTFLVRPAVAVGPLIWSQVRSLGGFALGIGIRVTKLAADGDETAPTSAVIVNASTN